MKKFELKEKIVNRNKSRELLENYLKKINMHLCSSWGVTGIFTNEVDSKYMGLVDEDYTVESIKWNV